MVNLVYHYVRADPPNKIQKPICKPSTPKTSQFSNLLAVVCRKSARFEEKSQSNQLRTQPPPSPPKFRAPKPRKEALSRRRTRTLVFHPVNLSTMASSSSSSSPAITQSPALVFEPVAVYTEQILRRVRNIAKDSPDTEPLIANIGISSLPGSENNSVLVSFPALHCSLFIYWSLHGTGFLLLPESSLVMDQECLYDFALAPEEVKSRPELQSLNTNLGYLAFGWTKLSALQPTVVESCSFHPLKRGLWNDAQSYILSITYYSVVRDLILPKMSMLSSISGKEKQFNLAFFNLFTMAVSRVSDVRWSIGKENELFCSTQISFKF